MIEVFLGLAAAAAEPAVHVQLPHPLQNYISPLDYPAAALPQRAEGRVELTLAVDAGGRLSGCSIRKSSGSAILDTWTCEILRRRLKFVPARSSTGEPTVDQIDVGYDWHLPPRP